MWKRTARVSASIMLLGSITALPAFASPEQPGELPVAAGAASAGGDVQRVGAFLADVEWAAVMNGLARQAGEYVASVVAEQESAAIAAAQARARVVTPTAPRTVGGIVGACTGFPIPDYIIQRESGGNPNAYNASSGAIGCSQTLISHYGEKGPCAGDDPYTVDGQRACTQTLYDRGGLAPWAETR